MRKTIHLLLLLFLLSVLSYTSAQPFGQSPNERERTYDVENIKIEVKLDLENKTVDGKVTTAFRSLADHLTSFKVDAVGMNIKSVKGWVHNTTDNPNLAESFEDIKYTYDKKEIAIQLPGIGLAKNFPYKYQVEYSVTDPEKGLYFIQPTPTFPNKTYQVWSQGEGEDNRYWFPCYDYPNEKQTTEVVINVDSKYQTLSNGILKNKNSNSDGTTTWDWIVDKPHSSYLVMVAAGNWDVIEDSWNGIPVNSYVPVGTKDIALKSFDRTSDMINFFSEKIGFEYPWKSFSQIVVEDYIYGGMENTGAIVYYDGSVYDDKTPPDYTATNLIAHEIAHQWWGDVLTCRNWNEVWLNEGFATYFQCLYTEYAFGKDEFDYNIFLNGNGAITSDSTNARKPIYIRDGLTVNTYDKGSVVLNMLRKMIGDDKFWKAMNIYITKNQFTIVNTQNLIDAVNEAFDDKLKGQVPPNLKWFFDEWIYSAGQPEFKADCTYNESTKELTLNVNQIQRLDTSSIFRTPVPLKIVTRSGTIMNKFLATDNTNTFTFALDDAPLYVLFNTGNSVLCKLYFSKPKQDWLNQWHYSEDAIDRITALYGMRDLINTDANVLGAFQETLNKDSFWGVRNETASILGKANTFTALEMLMQAFENEKDSRIRKTIITSIAGVKLNAVEQINADWLYGWIKRMMAKEQSYYVIAEGITTISKILKKEEIYDAVIPYLERDSHNEIIRRSIMPALDSSKDNRALAIFLEYGEKGSTSRLRNAAINGLSNYLTDKTVIEFLNRKILEKPRSTQNVILALIEKAGDPSSKSALEKAMTNSNDEGFKKRIKEVMDKL